MKQPCALQGDPCPAQTGKACNLLASALASKRGSHLRQAPGLALQGPSASSMIENSPKTHCQAHIWARSSGLRSGIQEMSLGCSAAAPP